MSDDAPQRKHRGGKWTNIPTKLREFDQWTVTVGKRPFPTQKGWEDRLLPFNRACRRTAQIREAFKDYQERTGLSADGQPVELGFNISEDDPFVLLDFDDIGDPHDLDPDLEEILETLGTYTEISQSGSGLHLLCEGELLDGFFHKAELPFSGTVEFYESSLVVITGDRLDAYPSTVAGYSDVDGIQSRLLQEKSPRSQGNLSPSDHVQSPGDRPSVTASDVKATIREYSKTGTRSATRAYDLWESIGAESRGYTSPSEADLALCADLAFWCRKDAKLIDDCFRESDRYRAKWDEEHRGDGLTYGEMTVDQAIGTTTDVFSGHYVTRQ